MQRLVARDRHDLVRRRTGLCQSGCGSLSDAVRRAMRQIGLPAPILELVPEPIRRERPTELGEQERHVGANLRHRNALGERWVQRDVDVDRIAVFVLCLAEA